MRDPSIKTIKGSQFECLLTIKCLPGFSANGISLFPLLIFPLARRVFFILLYNKYKYFHIKPAIFGNKNIA